MAFSYPRQKRKRELASQYILASEEDIQAMLKAVGAKSFADLFCHIDDSVKFQRPPEVCPEFDYEDLALHMEKMAKKNHVYPSFIGDGLKSYRLPEICSHVAQIRGLSTAYTPYQPERSQGTLMTLWIYASALAKLTGFEAINASLYDRATCLFEAIKAAQKTQGKGHLAVICGPLFPGDEEVLLSMKRETGLDYIFVPHDPKLGTCDVKKLASTLERSDEIFAVVYSQVNALGLLEDVNAINSQAKQKGLQSIVIIDPVHLGPGGLLPPSEFAGGGADFLVGEGQHLCLPPSFGGPGLGIFGTRFNGQNKTAIRNVPGRLVGHGLDLKGLPCKAIVLSTREQHIRRERATSNICSNQSFVATMAGASLLAKGACGLEEALVISKGRAVAAVDTLTRYRGVRLAYPSPFWNEFVLRLGRNCDEVIAQASEEGLHIGANVSARVGGEADDCLMIFMNDLQEESHIDKLYQFFARHFELESNGQKALDIPAPLRRSSPVVLPRYSHQELVDYYQKLGEQNISPEDAIYPLGSCTMKYNPYINDFVASLEGFSSIHPQAPESDCQGALEVLYEIQQYFKAITGLAAVATAPVAGAQGELVGLKMFQAYHRQNGQHRNIILIPRSAHGTNPATAALTGFCPKSNGEIVFVDATNDGAIDLGQLQSLTAKYGPQICGIMITNPNTSGIFEERFKDVAHLIHSVGGLVYMDGANMNAIASWVNLAELGVDAVHNNLHKTWSIPHGGGGPGDAIVAVSEKLMAYMPGEQVVCQNGKYQFVRPEKSIGRFHRHFGNFGHKVRALTYLKRLGTEGISKMSAVAVVSSRYLYEHLKSHYSTLPVESTRPKMHEFILTLNAQDFKAIEKAGIAKAQIMARIGKLFLDYGLHAPTVAFPEQFGLLIEPTESFNKQELDRFIEVLKSIKKLLETCPEVLATVPHFTPISRVDEAMANRQLELSGSLDSLPEILNNRISPRQLGEMDINEIEENIRKAHKREIGEKSARPSQRIG